MRINNPEDPTKVNKSGDTMTGDLTLSGNRTILGTVSLTLNSPNGILYLTSLSEIRTTVGAANVLRLYPTQILCFQPFFPVSFATGSAPAFSAGGIWWNSTTRSFMLGCDGTTWVAAATLSAARENAHNINKAASANVRNSHDAVATSTAAAYTKVKTIKLINGLVGQQRFLFDLQTGTSPTAAYGRIYRNGAALGTEQTDTTGSYVTKSEDITQTWAPGDTAELYVHGNGALTVSVQNFRIAYDDSPVVAVDYTTSSP